MSVTLSEAQVAWLTARATADGTTKGECLRRRVPPDRTHGGITRAVLSEVTGLRYDIRDAGLDVPEVLAALDRLEAAVRGTS